MSTAQRLMSADEFFALPEPPEGGKMELVHGEVRTMSPVGYEHGRLAYRIASRLGAFAEEHGLGEPLLETGYRLERDPDHVLAPDVSFVASGSLPPDQDPRKYIDGPPTLAVEVTSPDDRDREVSEKVADYLRAGASRAWVVRPELRTVTVHRPGGDAHTYTIDDTLSSDDAGFGIPGFALPLREIFA